MFVVRNAARAESDIMGSETRGCSVTSWYSCASCIGRRLDYTNNADQSFSVRSHRVSRLLLRRWQSVDVTTGITIIKLAHDKFCFGFIDRPERNIRHRERRRNGIDGGRLGGYSSFGHFGRLCDFAIDANRRSGLGDQRESVYATGTILSITL